MATDDHYGHAIENTSAPIREAGEALARIDTLMNRLEEDIKEGAREGTGRLSWVKWRHVPRLLAVLLTEVHSLRRDLRRHERRTTEVIERGTREARRQVRT